jgi:alpha,alpha-trehalase
VARLPDDLQPIIAQVPDVRRRLVVLDFDGSLAPATRHPAEARLVEGARPALETLAELTEVAVLSARRVEDLAQRLDGLPVTLLGGHGARILTRDGERVSLVDVDAVSRTLDEVQTELATLVDERDGWVLERKQVSIAVHHRAVPLEQVAAGVRRVRAVLADRLDQAPGFTILEGKSVLELRPRNVDKGRAIAWLEQRFGDLLPLVVGDDITDEDAFRVAEQRGGDAVLVSPTARPTAARWRLDGPRRVVALLRGLTTHAGRLETTSRQGGRFHPIGDYAMIGDSRTAALVSPDASIDFLCVPRFDSPSVFGALLDPHRGGRFRLTPAGGLDVQRTYLGETNVLVTRFVDEGEPVAAVTDFFVYSRVNALDPQETGHLLLRRVEANRDTEVELEFQPRFDFARRPTTLQRTSDGLRATCGSEHLDLLLPDEADVEILPHDDGLGDVARGVVRLRAGQRVWLELRTRGAEHGPHAHLGGDDLLDLTVRSWGRWSRQIDYDGPWRDEVVRSALVLKGLVYEPTGALVAAPTTSLPEGLGGERNWDYRYAWIRDSAYVLECFLRVGHTREAETFIRWLSELTDHIGGASSLKPLYRITGEDDLTETHLDHLEGYEGSRPVRVGNGAADQTQLDIYGAALQLGYLTEQVGEAVPANRWGLILDIVDTVVERWEEPDAGLWEIRSRPRHHTFSKFQCWLAIDRATRIGRDLGLRAPYERWRRAAAEIRTSILTHGYDEELGSFVQAYGEQDVDASLLLLPLKGFIAPTDPRVRSTVEVIRRELEVADGLVLRYRTEDGLDGHEGAFLMCSFWLVELLARMGDLQEATRLFERLRSLGGPLALFAEEIDPATQAHLGNFPQGFSHVALIGAATAIDEELRSRNRPVTVGRARRDGVPARSEVIRREHDAAPAQDLRRADRRHPEPDTPVGTR